MQSKITLGAMLILLILSANSSAQTWLGIVNQSGADIRLAEIGLFTGGSSLEEPLFLGSLKNNNEAIWFFLGSNVIWNASNITGIVNQQVRRFLFLDPAKAESESERFPRVKLTSERNLLLISENGYSLIDRSLHKDYESKKIREAIFGVSLCSLLMHSKGIELSSTIDEETMFLSKLLQRYEISMFSPRVKPMVHSLHWNAYRNGFRNGWFSVLLLGLPEEDVVAFRLHGLFLPPPSEVPDIAVLDEASEILYEAFRIGRTMAKQP